MAAVREEDGGTLLREMAGFFKKWVAAMMGSDADAPVASSSPLPSPVNVQGGSQLMDHSKNSDLPRKATSFDPNLPISKKKSTAGPPRFSESDNVDSGVAGSLSQELPNLVDDDFQEESKYSPASAGVTASAASLERKQLFPRSKSSTALAEEVLLSKIQDLHMQLADLREMREAIAEAGVSAVPTSARSKAKSERLLVCSFRLPVSLVDQRGAGKLKVLVSAGGLLSALKQLKSSMKVRWIGATTGSPIEEQRKRAEVYKTLSEDYSYTPIFLDKDDSTVHLQLCNAVLWPLFHYLPLSLDGDRSYHPRMLEGYRKINEVYAEKILEQMRDGELVWIHDFHLFLVPQMLRRRRPTAKIGFFLHIPFPSAEIYRTLPVRQEILEGMLGSDLIGFHTYDYARHFLSACQRVLGLEVKPNAVEYYGAAVKVGIFPFGLDPTPYLKTVRSKPVIQFREELREQLAGKKIIIGVDRVDYIKGIPHKLLALEHFLQTHSEWIGRVLLIQIGVPSSSGREEYEVFRAEIHGMVGRINGEMSTLEDMPIHYLEQMISFEDLVALYSVADVALISSLRDGMNLVSYEYTVCQQENRGVLILSEFTGAAQSLPGALVCNPWDIEGISDCIFEALTMSDEERELKHKKIFRYIMLHSSALWGQNFISDLIEVSDERQKIMEKRINLQPQTVRDSLANSNRRLILIDYEGINGPRSGQVERDNSWIRLSRSLQALSADERNVIFLLADHDRKHVVDWVDDLGIGLATEYGLHFRRPMQGPTETTCQSVWETFYAIDGPSIASVMIDVYDLLDRYELQTPGSILLSQENSVSW